MKIFLNKEMKQGAVLFEGAELTFFYAVITWLKSKFTASERSEQIIRDVESILHNRPVPQKLTYVVENKICEKCCRMINLKADKYIVHTNQGAMSYKHQTCAPQQYKEGEYHEKGD